VPLRVLLADYFGLLNLSGGDAYERASRAAIGLKQLAKQEKLAIIVASQLSRAGGNGSEPVALEMLRDSGVVEESADFILGAWRPEKQRDISPEDYFAAKDVLRVAILKNRKGGEGRDVDLKFQTDSRRLYESADPFAELS
jgi:replicative DNA helicase